MTEHEIARYFEQNQPPVPQGFESRHDALLSRLTRNEGIVMKKKVSAALVYALLLALLAIGVAVAAGLGVFGQFAERSEDNRLQSLENTAQNYDVEIAVDETTGSFPAIRFAVTQAHYDGESLYVAYTLTGERFRFHFRDPRERVEIDEWDVSPREGSDGKRQYQGLAAPEDWAAMKASLESDGQFYAEVYEQFLGDGAILSDGTVLNPSRSDAEINESGVLTGYIEFENPLPASARQQDSLEIEFILARRHFLYYENTEGGYTKYLEDIPYVPLKVHVARNSISESFQAQAEFEDYNAAVYLTLSDVDVKAEIVMDAPQAWLDAWSAWGTYEGLPRDFLLQYNLYADGVLCKEIGAAVSVEEGMLKINMEYERPASYNDLRLRPEFTVSGEHPQEDIGVRNPPISTAEMQSMLPNGFPIEKRMDGYTIRVVQADVNSSSSIIEVEYVFDDENTMEALAKARGNWRQKESGIYYCTPWIGCVYARYDEAIGSLQKKLSGWSAFPDVESLVTNDFCQREDGKWVVIAKQHFTLLTEKPNYITLIPYSGFGNDETYYLEEVITMSRPQGL